MNLIKVGLTDEQLKIIKRAAKAAGVPVATYLRMSALKAATAKGD